MMGPKVAVALALCLVGLAVVPSVAAEETPQEPVLLAEPSMSKAGVCAGASAALAAPEAVMVQAVAGECSATADCWDGSKVTCTATGTSASCSFTDSDCDADPKVRGHCWSSDEGTKYCPRCPCEEPDCSIYEGRSCKPGSHSPLCNTFGVCARCFCTSGGIYICP